MTGGALRSVFTAISVWFFSVDFFDIQRHRGPSPEKCADYGYRNIPKCENYNAAVARKSKKKILFLANILSS